MRLSYDPNCWTAYYRIDENEKLLILFQFDRSEGYDLKVHPRGDQRNPDGRGVRRPQP